MAYIISVATQKGGVGKSTTTQALAISLANLGNKTLIIDLDSQGDETYLNGFTEDEIEDRSIADLLKYKSKVAAEDVIYKHKSVDNLWIIPATIDLAQTEVDMQSQPSREKILERKLEPITDNFDYIMIDCPPSLSILPINAFSLSDCVIIPVKTDSLSKRGMNQLKESIEEIKELINPKLEVFGVIATFYESGANKDKEIVQYLKENDRLLATIPKRVAVKERIDEGQSILEFKPNSDVSRAYKKVAKLIIEEYPALKTNENGGDLNG